MRNNDKDNRPVAAHVLKTAHSVVTTERGGQHGDAENSFAMIGRFWSEYLNNSNNLYQDGDPLIRVSAYDVAQMMTLLKIARAVHGDPKNADHYVDAAGYTALAAALGGVAAPMATNAVTGSTPAGIAAATLARTSGVIPDQKQDLGDVALTALAQKLAPETK